VVYWVSISTVFHFVLCFRADQSRCGQLIVSSTGGSASPSWVNIPGHVKSSDPGVHYQYWTPPNGSHNGYVIPGPSPYKQGNTGSNRPIEDRKERGTWNCVVENANWCAKAVPGFKNVGECWSVSFNSIYVIYL